MNPLYWTSCTNHITAIPQMGVFNYVLKHYLDQGMDIIRLNTFSLQFWIYIYKSKK